MLGTGLEFENIEKHVNVIENTLELCILFQTNLELSKVSLISLNFKKIQNYHYLSMRMKIVCTSVQKYPKLSKVALIPLTFKKC